MKCLIIEKKSQTNQFIWINNCKLDVFNQINNLPTAFHV